ncbi:hypothetical protein [Roseovarius sp. MBR-6]|jgi:hypothetical protein|uniref:hypothetical protein n=1 Tax=Roseovarius sp. MBR-6 TaxID=3156459 RepID=UPI0033995F5F
MSYRILRTVIAAARLEAGTEAGAEEIGTPEDIARLTELGAIEEVGDDAPAPSDLPELDDALRVALIGAINALPKDAFDQGGKPKVKALEAALPEHKDRITAALRDLIWDEMKAAADAAS